MFKAAELASQETAKAVRDSDLQKATTMWLRMPFVISHHSIRVKLILNTEALTEKTWSMT